MYHAENIEFKFSRPDVHVEINGLKLLTHVRLVRQNVLILSDVSLYVERSKNLEKKYVITVQKKFTFLRGFDRKNKVFGISRNLIDRFVFK